MLNLENLISKKFQGDFQGICKQNLGLIFTLNHVFEGMKKANVSFKLYLKQRLNECNDSFPIVTQITTIEIDLSYFPYISEKNEFPVIGYCTLNLII